MPGTIVGGSFSGVGVAPFLSSITVISPTQVDVTFSEDMSTVGLTTAANYVLTEDVGSTARTVTSALRQPALSVRTVRLTFSGAVTAGTNNYNVAVYNVTDVPGNALNTPVNLDFSGPVAQVHVTAEITNHCPAAKDRLAAQFHGKTNIEALVCLAANKVQEVEQAFADILGFRSLNTAYGDTLDSLGVFLGVTRDGMTDDDYRVLLKGAALIVQSTGSPEELIQILEALNPYGGVYSTIREDFPAHIYVTTQIIDLNLGIKTALLLLRAKPAGVHMNVELIDFGTTVIEWTTLSPVHNGPTWTQLASSPYAWRHVIGA